MISRSIVLTCSGLMLVYLIITLTLESAPATTQLAEDQLAEDLPLQLEQILAGAASESVMCMGEVNITRALKRVLAALGDEDMLWNGTVESAVSTARATLTEYLNVQTQYQVAATTKTTSHAGATYETGQVEKLTAEVISRTAQCNKHDKSSAFSCPC